ncbi:unnamed protein product [Closterium sp. Naga37s-1]|nr:unnamed protein product [Closterium sp. Naga37s-1]
MAPKRRLSKASKKGMASGSDAPVVDPPYVAWMKKRQAEGDRRGRLRSECAEARDGEPFGDPDNQPSKAPAEDNEASSSSDPEEFDAFESSDSEADSDASLDTPENDFDGADEDNEIAGEGPVAADDIGTSAPKRRGERPKKKRKVWSELEMTEMAVARWFTREDLKAMQGKQGAQYWKKLRRHIRKANKNWVRKSEAMKQQWKRMEREFKEINDALNVSGNANIVRPPWFTYMEDLRAGSAAPMLWMAVAPPRTMLILTRPWSLHPLRQLLSKCPWFKEQNPQPIRSKRVAESATMTGAKLIADTLKACNQEGLAKLDQITALIMNAVAAASAAPEVAAANVGQADPTTLTVTLDHGDPTSPETCNTDYTYTPSSEETAAPTDMGPTNGEAAEFQQ